MLTFEEIKHVYYSRQWAYKDMPISVGYANIQYQLYTYQCGINQGWDYSGHLDLANQFIAEASWLIFMESEH